LKIDSGEPLLVRWQYGLGRVVAFLSDARGRWSAEWVRWPAFGTLWPQMVRDVSHRDRTVRAGVRRGSRGGESVVYYDVLSDSESENPLIAAFSPQLPPPVPPEVMVTNPGEASPHAVALEETAPGHYEARVQDTEGGLYRIASGNPEFVLPDVGFYREAEELKPLEINVPLLSELSRATGGKMEPTMAQLLDDRGTYVRERQPLWPYFLVVALLLNFIEVALRKGHFQRIVSWYRGRPGSSVHRSSGTTMPRVVPEDAAAFGPARLA
jgi:Ca-activated chloride channel family protein